MIRLGIVDDSAAMRQLIRQSVEGCGGIALEP